MSQETTPDLSADPIERFPRIPLAVTLLVLMVWAVFRFKGEELNEATNINPGIINLLPYLLTLIAGLFWLYWLAFRSGLSRGLGIFLALLPILGLGLFLYFVQIIFDGDAGIIGMKLRHAARTDLVTADESAKLIEQNNDIQTLPLGTSEFDFPQFLGPDRNSKLSNVSLVPSWDEQPPELIWRQPIGEGWSGFAVVNGKAITQEQRAEKECVTCYDITTGELIWIHSETRRHEDTMAFGRPGPRATPTVYNGKVYVQGGTGILDCLDGSNGKPIWSVDIPERLGIDQKESVNSLGISYTEEANSLAWGRSASPLIHDGNVVIPGGGPTGGPFVSLLAFDAETGEEKWRGGERMVAYGSPSLATLAGVEQILLVTEAAAVGHDPQTGKELWAYERVGASNGAANCSQVTLFDENSVVLSKGYNVGGEWLRLEKSGDEITTESVWKNSRVLKTKLTSPVISNGFSYSLSDGFLECVNIEENERCWKKRGRFGNGQLLLVDDILIVHTESGGLYLVKATPDEYVQLGIYDGTTVKGTCWNTIALFGDLLLVRSELEAACFRLPVQGGPLIEVQQPDSETTENVDSDGGPTRDSDAEDQLELDSEADASNNRP